MKTESRRRSKPFVTMLLLAIAAGAVGRAASVAAQDPPVHKEMPRGPIEDVVAAGVTTPGYLRVDAPYQSGTRCGPNALFIMLRLLGQPIAYEEVLKKIPTGPQGSNIQQIVDAAASLGIACSARKEVSPEDLKQAPKPAIVHLKYIGDRDTDASGAPAQDHFVVVVGYSDQEKAYVTIDTTNLVNARLTPQGMARNMTGYCIFPDPSAAALTHGLSWSNGSVAAVVLVFALLLSNLFLWILRRVPRGPRPVLASEVGVDDPSRLGVEP